MSQNPRIVAAVNDLQVAAMVLARATDRAEKAERAVRQAQADVDASRAALIKEIQAG